MYGRTVAEEDKKFFEECKQCKKYSEKYANEDKHRGCIMWKYNSATDRCYFYKDNNTVEVDESTENNYLFVVKREGLVDDDYENVGVFLTRDLAEEYIKKHIGHYVYHIEAVKLYDDFIPEKTVAITTLSTTDGKNFQRDTDKLVVSDKYICQGSDALEIFEEIVTIEDDNEVVINLVTNRELTHDEKTRLIRTKYDKHYSKLIQAHQYNIGDEVLYGNDICYVIRVLDNEKVYVLTPSKRTAVADTINIKPTGKFSSEIAKFFSRDYEIKTEEV